MYKLLFSLVVASTLMMGCDSLGFNDNTASHTETVEDVNPDGTTDKVEKKVEVTKDGYKNDCGCHGLDNCECGTTCPCKP